MSSNQLQMFTIRFKSGLVVHTKTLHQAISASISNQSPMTSIEDPDGFEIFDESLPPPTQALATRWIACHKGYPPVLLPLTVDLATTLFKWINATHPTEPTSDPNLNNDGIATVRAALAKVALYHHYHLLVKGYGEVRLYRVPPLQYTAQADPESNHDMRTQHALSKHLH